MVQRTCGAAMPTMTAAQPGASIRAAGRNVWNKVSSLVYLPALLVPAVALLLVGAGWATGWGGVDFAGSLTSLRFVTIGPLAVGDDRGIPRRGAGAPCAASTTRGPWPSP